MAGMTREQVYGLIKEIVGEVVAQEVEPLKRQSTDLFAQTLAAMQRGQAKPEDKGLQIARLVRAVAAGKGDPDRALSWAKRQKWSEDDLVVKALAAGDGAAGGFIVPPDWSADIIEYLRAQTAVRKLRATQLPMPNGTLTIPRLTGGATASYVGENSNVAKTEQTFGNIVLTEKKLAALVPISNDLIRFSSPQADMVVRDDLVSALAVREDQAFIRDDGTANTPKGIRYWAASANVIAANGTVNLANVTTDLGKLLVALMNANVRMIRPGWIFAPRIYNYLATVRDANGNFAFRPEMLSGTLWNYPFVVTTTIPTNLGGGTNESEVYLVDFADVVIGDATSLILDASTEAAYYDGSSVQAAFSLDQTVIRAIARHDIALRHAESAAVLTTVTWT